MAVLICSLTDEEYVSRLTFMHGLCVCEGRVEDCDEAQTALRRWQKRDATVGAVAS